MAVSQNTFKTIALAFPEAVELPHFEIPSFRHKKKIFATLWVKENKAMVRLSLVDQSVFCSYDSSVFYPVPNAWGKKGATLIELAKVKKSMLTDALQCAYQGVIKSKPK